MQNQVQLITYVDRLSGGGFKELRALLDGPLAGVFGGVHLLPFFDAAPHLSHLPTEDHSHQPGALDETHSLLY